MSQKVKEVLLHTATHVHRPCSGLRDCCLADQRIKTYVQCISVSSDSSTFSTPASGRLRRKRTSEMPRPDEGLGNWASSNSLTAWSAMLLSSLVEYPGPPGPQDLASSLYVLFGLGSHYPAWEVGVGCAKAAVSTGAGC